MAGKMLEVESRARRDLHSVPEHDDYCYGDDDPIGNGIPPNNNVCDKSSCFATDAKCSEASATVASSGELYAVSDPMARPFDESNLFGSVLNPSNGVVKKAGEKAKKRGVVRGRPRKGTVSTYESHISGDKNTIKIRIKKNLTHELAPNKKKSGRRKKRNQSDTDTSDYESPKKKSRAVPPPEASVPCAPFEPLEQSPWGDRMPEHVLHKIFHHATLQEGCLPLLVRLSKVCKLWRDVSLAPSLWQKVDLNWVCETFRTDQKLNWLIDNRLSLVQDLNLGIWKLRNTQTSLEYIIQNCPELRGLNLNSWKGLNGDSLKYISTECGKLERLDISSINWASSINAQPLVSLAQTMGSRLTHLVLAHNKIAGFGQIMAALSANCPNLQLLDISNIRMIAHTALLHVEKLQDGCPKLKVLRMTNSQISLAPTNLSEQVSSPGFPMLEELSVAGIKDDPKITTARSIDDDGLERILKNSTKLRLLDIRGCIKLTDSGLVKVPAWDLEHLFLSACCITRTTNSRMELIMQKWAHSLLEVDLAWSTATEPLDAAVYALAEKGSESPLRSLNLCGSSVSLEPIKAVLTSCPNLQSINLQSCRALPRGIKRLYKGDTVKELRESLLDRPRAETVEEAAAAAAAAAAASAKTPSPEDG